MARRKFKRTREIPNLPITKIAAEGKGLGRDDKGKIVFVDYAIPGDVVNAFVYKGKKDVDVARINQLITPSPLRKEPFCPEFGVCGGCRWQNVSYKTQLDFKHQIVTDALTHIGKLDLPEIRPVLGGTEQQEYRNKLDFSFSNSRWLTTEQIESGQEFDKSHALGFHVPGYFDKIIDIQKCYLQDEKNNTIRNAFRTFAIEQGFSFYDHHKKEGFLRSLVLRNSTLNQWLVLLVVGENDVQKIEASMDFFTTNFPEIHSLYYIINEKLNDSFYDLEPIHVYGEKYIEEKLHHCTFRIGPKSFFQPNTKQAENLYAIVEQFAELKGNEIVFDLFTGTGTIANYIAKKAKHVVGIELIDEAIENAKENATSNGNDNCSFYAGKVEDLFSNALINKYGKPDVIIVDPPRAGLHKDVIQQLIELKCNRIVYVSCNPSTQARDVSLLQELYEISQCQPVDLFPQTFHIENVMQLTLKDDKL